MENTEENSEKIWKLWKKDKLNSEKIWKIQKKSKLKCEIIWKIWKKAKLNSEMIWKIWKISVLVMITPKETPSYSSSTAGAILLLLRRRRRSGSHSVKIPPKTRYKEKQNETHYENIRSCSESTNVTTLMMT